MNLLQILGYTELCGGGGASIRNITDTQFYWHQILKLRNLNLSASENVKLLSEKQD